MTVSLRWDIFCRVVDNFGDAGVCWRLARQLADRHGLMPTLWIDDVAVLARIVPGLVAERDDQAQSGVRVRRPTAAALDDAEPADVVIDAFGGGLPDRYVEAMARARRKPVCIVLEYLSAEPWVEASHGLPSPHPRLPLMRWFWFPGFTPRTGGVLREDGLLDRRDAYRADAATRNTMLHDAGIEPMPRTLKVSLFCYINPALPALLDTWAQGDERIVCIVPEGVARAELDAWTGVATLAPARPFTRGRLTLATVPFVDQDAFDRRLWSCDLNIVRGEDSFVRAQWAGEPFVWHVYPQEGDAHLAKMDAFLARFEHDLPPSAATAQRAFWYALNAGVPAAAAEVWSAYRAAMPALGVIARAWARALARQTDLVAGLVKFAESRL